MARALLTTAALLAAVGLLVLAAIPPRRLALDPTWSDGTLPGLLHVHTSRSDGRQPPEIVAEAAARAGLRFLVFTDHGSGVRPPDPPVYRSGVLCLDAVEVSTTGGHYLALDIGASPYPLGGEPRDVVEDVRRLGGFGIAAHPDSPKSELRWQEWTAPIDAIEIINPDTSWRVRLAAGDWRSRFKLVEALLAYPLRPSESIAGLLTRADASLAAWADLAEQRRVVAVAGVDAHAKLEIRNGDPGDNRYSFPIPGYESSFRSLSVRVRPDERWSGEAAADARSLLKALRSGHLYTAVDGWAAPPAFEFTATHAGGTVQGGDEFVVKGPVTLAVRTALPPGYSVNLWQGRQPLVASRREDSFTVQVGETPAAYRAEIRSDAHPDGPPWVISNPIYVRRPSAPPQRSAATRARDSHPLFDGRTTGGWTVESDKTSVAAIEAAPRLNGTELRLRFGLSGGGAIGQFAGAVVETPTGIAAYDRVRLRARAERPMRVSFQVRSYTSAGVERWQRSIYLDADDEDRIVVFDEMTPVGQTHAPHPPLAAVRHLMFVIDTTNTSPGTSGRVWLSSVQLERAAR